MPPRALLPLPTSSSPLFFTFVYTNPFFSSLFVIAPLTRGARQGGVGWVPEHPAAVLVAHVVRACALPGGMGDADTDGVLQPLHAQALGGAVANDVSAHDVMCVSRDLRCSCC